ncbi:MAG: ABC transporter ATP-binding protein [Planctomycetota bacterium]
MSVSLQDLTIRYGDVVAVTHASATFPDGAVGLLGRNGAGKSSILRALLGLVPPAAGALRVLGLAPDENGDGIRRRVGYMPERDASVAGLNGFETVRLAGRLTGLTTRDAARRAHEVLYLVGLDEQRYRPVAGYSAGMRQKVKLAAALVHDPELLFLDEPTNGLDPRGRTDLLRLIRALAQDLGKSVVLSSHILQDVESVCDHVVVMERGRVLAAGPLDELTRTSSRTFRLATSASGPALRQALLARGSQAVEVDERSGGSEWVVTVPSDLDPSALFAAVLDVGGTVDRLAEHRRSLEEVFLAALDAAEVTAL